MLTESENETDVIGLDVGFSDKRPSSGVARLRHGDLRLGHTTSRLEERMGILGTGGPATVTAIDAPILGDHSSTRVRSCERLFARGAFQRRCKPGFSHVPGTGQRFRIAGRKAADDLARLTSTNPAAAFPRVMGEPCIVEAFPNAFLGVCLSDEDYAKRPDLRRGKKFDWLYDRWIAKGLFEEVMLASGLQAGREPLCKALQTNSQHDERAALICLLTALGVSAGRYVAVGDPNGGYFFTPPWQHWDRWAREEVDRQRQRLDGVDVWIDGTVYHGGDGLPRVR